VYAWVESSNPSTKPGQLHNSSAPTTPKLLPQNVLYDAASTLSKGPPNWATSGRGGVGCL